MNELWREIESKEIIASSLSHTHTHTYVYIPTSLVSLLSWTKSRSNTFLFSPLSVSGVFTGRSITPPTAAYNALLLHLAEEEEDKVVAVVCVWGRKRPAAAAGVALCPPQKKAWATPARTRKERRRRGTCRLIRPAMVALCVRVGWGVRGVGTWAGIDTEHDDDEEDTSVSNQAFCWDKKR